MIDNIQDGLQKPATPEQIIPRLGESLIQAGYISQPDLEKALTYQKIQKSRGRTMVLGQALIELGLIEREKLDKVVIQQLITLHAMIEETNLQLEKKVHERTQNLENRLVQIRTVAEITQIAISAHNLEELLKKTVKLIVDRFGFHIVSLFLIDESGRQGVLTEVAGLKSEQLKARNLQIEVGSRSMIGWVLAHNETRISSDVSKEAYYFKEEILTDTMSEATIPLSMGNQVLGALDVQHTVPNAFDPESVAILQTIANHFTAVIQNYRLLNDAQIRLREVSSLYNASHRLEQARTVHEIFQAVSVALQESPVPAALLRVEGTELKLNAAYTDDGQSLDLANLEDFLADRKEILTPEVNQPDRIAIAELESYLDPGKPMLVLDLYPEENPSYGSGSEKVLLSDHYTGPISYVEALSRIPLRLGYRTVVFLPVRSSLKIEALIMIGSYRKNGFSQASLQSYASLCEQASTALEKVNASQRLEKRLAALETLNAVSQAVSIQTDLGELYKTIHREVSQILGDVSLLIAIYNSVHNTIEIPYMVEEDRFTNVEPFPLGEGLISILIDTCKPFMVVEGADRRLEEMGPKLIARPAKSWLGVPLLVAGEVIGAMVVQDFETEQRFDEDDQRLMTTLASQVAVAIRNARLLENSQHHAERERLLNQISNKLRSSTDINTIMTVTTEELRKALGARRAQIKIVPSPYTTLKNK